MNGYEAPFLSRVSWPLFAMTSQVMYIKYTPSSHVEKSTQAIRGQSAADFRL